MPSYSTKQQEPFLKGLRSLARVAIRVHMERLNRLGPVPRRTTAARRRNDGFPALQIDCRPLAESLCMYSECLPSIDRMHYKQYI